MSNVSQTNGATSIKLDELAAPTDVTTLNASTTAHGLLPKLDNVVTHFLNGQGGYTAPAGGGSDKGCRVYNSGNLALTAGSWVALTFDSERYDTDTMHSTVSNTGRITFTTAGKYLVIANIVVASGYVAGISIRLNGVTELARSADGPIGGGLTTPGVCTTIYSFSANDYVEVLVYTPSVGVNVIAAGNYSPEFMAQKIDAGG